MAMDIQYFLTERLNFIEQYYEWSAETFTTIKSKIEHSEEPYAEVDSEGGESPYQDVWNRCHESLDVLGQHCVTMLASATRLFLDAYVNRMNSWYGIAVGYKRKDKQGWLNGYREMFLDQFRIDWANSPASLEVIEQIVLARNDFEHSAELHSINVRQNSHHFSKYKDSFFADEFDVALFRVSRESGLGEDFPIFSLAHECLERPTFCGH